jgi:hypothetical protein
MPENASFWSTVFSAPVLVTFIVCAAIFGAAAWLMSAWHRRQRDKLLADQRTYQEATVQRLLDSVSDDKDQVIAEYEARLRERDAQISALEGNVARLRDRLSSSGILGLFGGKQRDVVGALLLENEQLHELLLEKQEQLRHSLADMTTQMLDRMDEQTRATAQAVRYKQALLSAFLQQEEARQMLDRLLADGRLGSAQPGAADQSEGGEGQ